ncbi:hypothetical protein F5X68DRAFT_275739 [Plectosphaerella plurivora]|uniref:PHD-type domain-containing protein n=1 Tax=Plectosphaerella plurivora TaxID=936078 RepID=A0A9P8V9Z7_9PEZI|nr:hypothetical protein F5X68DRAFT_275739 [Plectosphaerella plurivora]
MATAVDDLPAADEALSPKTKVNTMETDIQRSLDSMDNSLSSLEARADPDAQATVTDFLDFTEYLPSDMIRSMTLIGKLDEKYQEASDEVHKLTTTWGQLPSIHVDERPAPVQLRADISQYLTRAVDSRSFAHAEAIRMSENVNRHYARAKTILSKLQTMLDNYPTLEEQQKSPVAVSKSPQLTRTKSSVRGADGEKVRRPMVPRITVPGEVLAPYDQFQPYSSGTESSSDEEEEEEDVIRHRTPGRATPAPRIKVVKPPKTPKPPKSSTARTPKSATQRAAPAVPAVPLVEPPPNAVIGSTDAPWLQLTPWEMARLRKRMKKNATWTPSDTMISRELNDLGRGIDAYRAAKKKAEEEGKQFDPAPPALAAESDTGNMKTPEGALSAAAIKSDEVQLSNRGMKLNEAKKLKRESLAKQAAEEAEESARRFNETARRLMGPQQSQQSPQSPQPQPPPPSASKARTGRANSNGNGSKAPNSKRKRDSVTEADAPKENGTLPPIAQPPLKRTKTETPVPLPHMRASLTAQPLETPVLPPVLTPGGSTVAPHSTTPVPVPVPGNDHAKRTVSPALSKESITTITTTVPVKPPAETPIPPPILSPKKSTTPIFPPVREQTRRETRGEAAKKVQQDAEQAQQVPTVQTPAQAERSSSAAPSNGRQTRSVTPASLKNGRPGSRGKAASQEPQPSAAADRPRRLSTARNTPAPPGPVQQQQTQQAQAQARGTTERRTRRPAPGVVSTTTSGGSSAVGRRKKKPSVKKSQKKDAEELEEIDDEGNPIDPEEQRYCVCNGVSYGTMISCDNANCALEWFHIGCVGLTAIPARTTKWYCPECRVKLNIGEKGEVNARGVKM